jgi:hypothetical protein
MTATDTVDHLIGIQRGIVWNVDDYDKLQEYMNMIKTYNFYHDYQSAHNLTTMLNSFIRQTFNDHHPTLLHKTHVSAIDASWSHNKITASGIIGLVLILSNQSNRFFNYFSMGRGTTPEAIGQKHLIDEEVRVSMLVDGGITAHGNVWNHVANLGYGVRSGTYYEFGIHDGPLEPSLMLSRSVLPNGLIHVQNDSFMTASHSTIFVAK